MSQLTQSTPETLGRKSIGSLLLQYSVPAVIASVATSLYNIIDSIFIGRGVGAMAIAGLAITFPLMNLVMAFCMFIAVGGAAVSSIFLGQQNRDRATDVLNNVLVLCLIHSVVFGGLAFVFLDDILIFFGATDSTIPFAREFMQVILLGSPISYVFIGLNNIMRATGYPRKAMISALLSVVANIIIAPILIFKLDWGIRGAAFSTICGQTVALIWVLIHFSSSKSFVHFDFRMSWLKWTIVRRIYAIGMSPFLMNVCACVVVIFINHALLDCAGSDGDLAVGAFGILNRTTMFFVMIVFGVTQGMQPILGYTHTPYRNMDRCCNNLSRLGFDRAHPVDDKFIIYRRSDTYRDSQSRIPHLLHLLSACWRTNNYPELFSGRGPSYIFYNTVADPPAIVTYSVPFNISRNLGS